MKDGQSQAQAAEPQSLPCESVIFMAYDNALPAMLEFYAEERQRQGASRKAVADVYMCLGRILAWREKHPELCRDIGDPV